MTVHSTSHHDDHQCGEDGPSSNTRTGDNSHRMGSPHTGCPEQKSSGSPDEAVDVPLVESPAGSPEVVPSQRSAMPAPVAPPRTASAAGREVQARARPTGELRTPRQMASGIAHDLIQSLALIAGYAELLERELAAPSPDLARVREYATTMRSAANDGGEMARRLLASSRAEGLGSPVQVDARSLLHDVARLTAPRWRDTTRAAGHPVSLSIRTDDESLDVLGWPSSLRDALTSLVLNAVDALPNGGEIRLGARRDRDCVELLVADTGIGMAPEVRARIFEPFFTTKGEHGTGLGLAQVFAIVQQHGGEVDVYSVPGQGTTFALRLPATPAGRTDRGGSRRGAEGGPLRVLAVDDDPSHGRLLAAMLGHDGHQVTVVRSAEAALERLAEASYDVVVADLDLRSGEDGWQLAEHLRRHRPGVRVCLVTGWGEAIDRSLAAERGVSAVLAKPYALHDLLTVVGAR